MQIGKAAGRFYIEVDLYGKDLLYGELFFVIQNSISFHFANFKLKAFKEANQLNVLKYLE